MSNGNGRRPAAALKRVSTVDAVVDAVREQILEGVAEAGSGLREIDLCDEFGVSRHTVRSALLRLSHQGLVRLEPNRGAIVADPGPDDVDDIYMLRTALELEATRLLFEKPERLELVRDAMRQMREMPADSPWGAVRDADLNFHRSIVVAGLGGERAARAMDPLLSELRLCFRQIRYEFEHHTGIVEQHEILLEAFEAEDADAAISLLRERLDGSREDIREQIGRHRVEQHR